MEDTTKSALLNIPIELCERFDARRKSLGVGNRTKAILMAMHIWADAEPVTVDEPSICSGCKYAGLEDAALHCRTPGKVIGTEPDRDWNSRCKPGHERFVRRICVCEVCKKSI